MALSVDYNYNYILDLINKNQAGGLNSEKFQTFWNAEQAAYMDDLLGRFQSRNNGKEGVNTGLIQNETILQKLSPFTKPATLTITAGQSDKPAGLVYRLGLRIGNYDVFKINHSQIASVQQSVIDPPSATTNTYYFVEYEDYYKFFPSTVTSASLDYIVAPTDVVWGFTYDVDGRQVYDSGTSVQPLWDDNSCREICKRVLKSIGVTFKDKDFDNFGQSNIVTGD